MSVWNRNGFSVAELLVVIAVIGILALLALPWWLTSLPAQVVRAGAREVQSGLHQARLFAITTRQSICVQAVPGGFRFLQGGCAGAAWTGLGTDGAGTFRPSNNVALAGPNSVFTPFGTASQTGVLTVTGPSGNQLTVTVWPSGRVSIP